MGDSSPLVPLAAVNDWEPVSETLRDVLSDPVALLLPEKLSDSDRDSVC